MQTTHRSPFLTIHTEGALLPVDLLQRVLAGDKGLDGLNPESYHLPSGEKLNEAINRAWNRLQGAWAAFQTSRGRLKEGDPGTTLTRERWLLPLFQELGYGRLQTAKAIEIEGKSYPISHTWGSAEAPVPIHLVGCGVELEKRQAGVSGAAKASPHSLIQELLNRDDSRTWGLVSNGLRLRVLRDNASLTRQAYLELDLEAMFGGEVYADFAVLWLVCHQSRLEGAKPEALWLERWSQAAQEQGTRALEGLRSGVEEAIIALGQGFLVHPANQALHLKLKSGSLTRQEYFRQLLRLVYRLIFLFVAEDRDLLLLPDATPAERERYLKYYSTARLRRLAERQRGGRHPDLWQGIKVLTDLLGGNQPGGRNLGLPVLGGFLFSHKALPDLEDALVDNQALLNAVRSLAFTQEKRSRRAVDYKNLGSEELGSVYESLLELQPVLNAEAGTFQLITLAGNERKTTGSYYTPSSLIKVLLDSALDPVIEQAVQKAGPSIENQQTAILNLKVCDPASGSGHFLIAAAHRIARRLAQLRSGDEEPSPSVIRHALREVIAHCIYAADINPMAVELCKFNLWLEALEPGKPLTFLDAHIKCGNSLVGVGPGIDIFELEVPDKAFDPVTGDDKKLSSELKKRNKQEYAGQESLFIAVPTTIKDLESLLAEHDRIIDSMPEETPEEVQAKESAFVQVNESPEYQRQKRIANLWASAFFWQISQTNNQALEVVAPTQGQLARLRDGHEVQSGLLQRVEAICQDQGFFHWPLEFAEVSRQGGFDCILGNPPWERIKLQEEEFFAELDPEIAKAPNKAARQKLIERLPWSNPALAKAFEAAKHAAECESKFVRNSSRFPMTAIGDVNTYALFADHFRSQVNAHGRAGIIVPTGIATDDTTKEFFGHLSSRRCIASLFDFENREAIFPGVHRSYKFCLLTVSSKAVDRSDFCFFCTRSEHLKDPQRRFSLEASEISLFNPNTLTMPIFRTRFDAELTQKIYKSVPVLYKDSGNENLWNIFFTTMFHSSSDAHFFIDPDELINSGFSLGDNGTYIKYDDVALPIYEGKMFMPFDHRAATVIQSETALVRKRQSENTNLSEHQNPRFIAHPQYWALRKNVPEKQRWNWVLCFKKVTSPTNERTIIATALPPCATNDSIHLIMNAGNHSPELMAALLANLNSLVTDYICRQKLGGVNLNFYVVKQLPILPPGAYTRTGIAYVIPRVLELTFTSYDIKPFAEDMGYHGEPFEWDEERRALLRAELDAYYAKLYGLTRDELRYILDPQDVYGPDFPGETFRVLKDKEIRQFGEYRTRRLVLDAWDRLEGVAPAVIERPAIQDPLTPVKEEYTPPAERRVPRSVREKPIQETPGQPMLSDFGLYKCAVCGKLVSGYDRENHTLEAHKRKDIEWKKVR